MLTAGVGYTLWGFRFDLGVARSFSGTRALDYDKSQIRQTNPINPSGAAAIGGGVYHADFTLLGVGLYKVF